jgi:putative cardiolipin synthase
MASSFIYPASFSLLLSFLLPVPLASADDLQFLDHSELALARLYNDISGAQESIDLTYLMWDPCSSVSKVLMKKLNEKIHPKKTAENPNPKPVKVRMLIDSYFHRTEVGAMQNYFAANGIDIKFFNPTSAPSGGNTHTHSKIALIDKKVPGKAKLITGGRNITDDYFGMGMKNFIDRDVAVTGPSASEDRKGTIAQAHNGYEKLWQSRYSKQVTLATQEATNKIKACTKWTAKDFKLEKYLQEKSKAIILAEKPVSCPDVRFTVDDLSHRDVVSNSRSENPSLPATPSEKLPLKPTTQAVLQLLQGAQKSLTLENQYFIPDDTYLKGILREQRRQGRRIDLYSNMFDGSTEKVTLWHTHYMKQENQGTQTNHSNFRIAGLLDRWEFTPPKASYSYHAKTFVADSRDAIVSSFNLDPRSVHINGESALIVKNCPVFAQKVEHTAQITGRVWTLEENYSLCMGNERPRPPSLDPISGLIQWISKDLQ